VSIPVVLTQAANLAYLAQLLAFQEGDPLPQPPASLAIPIPELIALLNDPDNRAYVVRRLSIFVHGGKQPSKR
jgi:hypothetical protein